MTDREARVLPVKRLNDLAQSMEEHAEREDPERFKTTHVEDPSWKPRAAMLMNDAAAILRGVADGSIVLTQ